MYLNPEEIAEVIGDKEDRANPSGIKPTVIYLMSESFFDVNRLPGVEFSRDPLENFRRIGRNYSGGNFISYT